MALTGICLVLFVTFHALMNAVAILWPTAYNQICLFLGANWYALVASAGLGLLVVIHIIYALLLTLQNRKARGNAAYKVSSRPASVEWSSKNMLVLGIVVLAFFGVHLVQFWSKMQLQELLGGWYTTGEAMVPPAAGTLFLQFAFENWYTPVIYIIGFVALWFHLNHGFWSMWQSMGLNNTTWLPRLKCIGSWWVSIVILLFVAQAVTFTVRANQNYYLTDGALLSQYREMYVERMQEIEKEVSAEIMPLQQAGELGLANPMEVQMSASDVQMRAREESQKLSDSFSKLMTLVGERTAKAEAEEVEAEPEVIPATELVPATPVSDEAEDTITE